MQRYNNKPIFVPSPPHKYTSVRISFFWKRKLAIWLSDQTFFSKNCWVSPVEQYIYENQNETFIFWSNKFASKSLMCAEAYELNQIPNENDLGNMKIWYTTHTQNTSYMCDTHHIYYVYRIRMFTFISVFRYLYNAAYAYTHVRHMPIAHMGYGDMGEWAESLVKNEPRK